MNTQLIPTDTKALAALSLAADSAAARHAIEDYRSRKADNTLRSQDNDLALFCRFVESMGVTCPDITDPACWQHITYGLVDAFVKWLLTEGYAIASVNRALSTVKVYAKLAAKSGTVTPEQLAMIRTVQGYSHKDAKRINERRETARIGRKKQEHTS